MINTGKHNRETKSGPRPVVRYKDFLGQESSSLIAIVLIVLSFRHAAVLFLI